MNEILVGAAAYRPVGYTGMVGSSVPGFAPPATSSPPVWLWILGGLVLYLATRRALP